MLPSYPTDAYQMDMSMGSNKYPPPVGKLRATIHILGIVTRVSSFPAGKFGQSHQGQTYPAMDNYMSQGMDPMHQQMRKPPGNPQASMAYGQVCLLEK